MKRPEISPDFTLDDIHRIREYEAERRRAMPEEDYWTEIHANALYMQEKIKEAREKYLAQEADNVSKAV
jgi:hypothetical protein